MPQLLTPKKLNSPMKTHKTFKNVIFNIGDWNAKVGSQKIPGVTGKFGFGAQNEAGQRLTSFAKRTHWS